MFRNLKANEIDARVQSFTEKGAILLLYKDARCDMNILDESVGTENWQREHYECKGNLFCRVGIKFANEWVYKSDCGAESNTEKEKGEASDSFKRACFNWGIGRELYSPPLIFVSINDINIYKDKNGKTQTKDKFNVVNIETSEDKQITGLIISNETTGKVVYTYGTLRGGNRGEKTQPKQEPTESQNESKMTLEQALKHKAKVIDMTGKEFILTLEEIYAKCRGKVKDLYEKGDAELKQAIELIEADFQKKKEQKLKELKELMNNESKN
jgi:hypothetical protein